MQLVPGHPAEQRIGRQVKAALAGYDVLIVFRHLGVVGVCSEVESESTYLDNSELTGMFCASRLAHLKYMQMPLSFRRDLWRC